MTATFSAKVGVAFPGSQSPSVGFDQPFEMLDACHERVSRTLRLLGKLPAHVRTHGGDRQAQRAATDVLRYFDIAAPLHHDDEELHVFPLLLQQNDAVTTVLVEKMLADHEQMSAQWFALRPTLVALSADDPARGVAHVVTEDLSSKSLPLPRCTLHTSTLSRGFCFRRHCGSRRTIRFGK